MKLTGKQVKQIHTAILDGYNPDSLRRLVRVHLDENLHNITSGSNFSDQVFALVEWAEQQGRVIDLVRAAYEENSNNPAIQSLWQNVQRWGATPTRKSGDDSPSAVAPPPPLLTRLRAVLATLYPDENSARRVTDDAGINGAQIAFTGRTVDNWHAILREAEKADKLAALMAVAWQDYSDNPSLQAVAAALDMEGLLTPEQQTRPQVGNLSASKLVQDGTEAVVAPLATSTQQPTAALAATLQTPQPMYVKPLPQPADSIAALVATMQDASLPPKTRLEAGLKAAALGDLPLDLDELVFMPAKAQLGYDFRIAKYPVTNYQYRRFVEEGGYDNDRWWMGMARWVDFEDPQWEMPAAWEWDDEEANRTTRPVAGICWNEAIAYCEWLNAQWRAAGTIDQNMQVQLPTQAEWIFAARSGKSESTADYPWQGPFDLAYANTEESRLNQTTPVHMYPHGCTLTGVWDMSGNIWEWTRDAGESVFYYLKGGCCQSNAVQASVSSYGKYGKRYRGDLFGLRVVVVPQHRQIL